MYTYLYTRSTSALGFVYRHADLYIYICVYVYAQSHLTCIYTDEYIYIHSKCPSFTHGEGTLAMGQGGQDP